MVRRRSTVRVRKGARVGAARLRTTGTSGRGLVRPRPKVRYVGKFGPPGGPLDWGSPLLRATGPRRGLAKNHDRIGEAVSDRRGPDSGGVAQG